MATKTTEEFIKQSNKIHQNKYNYTHTIYVNSHTKVQISCVEHGVFNQAPYCHTSLKQGCPTCGKLLRGNSRKKSTSGFITEATDIHNNYYDYSNVRYTRITEPVEIICPIHGTFSQTPQVHLQGSGCRSCGYVSNRMGNDEFISRSVDIHKNRYDYSKVQYTRIDNPVKIICPDHGTFSQNPQVHLQGSKCPTCATVLRKGGYSLQYFKDHPEIGNARGSLYIIEIFDSNERFIKIGITGQAISKRFSGHLEHYNYNIVKYIEGKLLDLFVIEQRLLELHDTVKYTPSKRIKGWTECFNISIREQMCGEI